MFINILKKDLKRKKVMNGVLFMFITLCTVFLASSVSNLFTTTNAWEALASPTHSLIFRNFAVFEGIGI